MHLVSLVWALLAVVGGGVRILRKRPTDCFSPIDGKVLLTLELCAPDEADALQALLDEGSCTLLSAESVLSLPVAGECALLSAACSSDTAGDLMRNKGATKISTDAGKYYREISGTASPFSERSAGKLSPDFYSQWRDLEAIMARVEAAVAASGGAAKLETFGQSVEGRDLKLVRLRGKGWSPGQPRLVMTFNVHAREWITAMAGTYAVEKIAAKAREDPQWLAGKEVVIVPMANPDGFKHSHGIWRFHRKNMQVVNGTLCTTGVDLNRNIGSSWGKVGASSKCAAETYRGPSAMSEPEIQSLDMMFKEAPMSVYFDVHSYGQLLLSAWSWTKDEHPRAAEFNDFGSKVHAALEGTHNTTWKFGPGAQTLYTASGVISDYATELGALGYTFELRPTGFWHLLGFTPPQSEILPSAQECFAGILVGIANLGSVSRAGIDV